MMASVVSSALTSSMMSTLGPTASRTAFTLATARSSNARSTERRATWRICPAMSISGEARG
jgi:hypothetical protein